MLQNRGRSWSLALVLALLPLTFAAAAQTIVLEGDVWEPYVMDPADGPEGFMVELAEEALTRAGYRVQFKVTPWTRALGDMDSGAANAVVGIYFAQARQRKYVVPAEDLGVSANAIYVAAGSSWKYSRPASLESMVLATIADYDYGELNAYIAQALKENSPRVQVMFGNGALEKNLKKLVAGRVTALVEDRVVVAYVARRMGFLGRIRSAGDVNPENPAGVAFSPRDPRAAEYARALSEGIEKLRASGELRKVLQRYGVADWK